MFDLETDTQVTHWWMDIIRSFFAYLDKAVYWLLMIMYEVFFNIADATILSSDTVKGFYSRIQLIIGVFMIFKVSVSLMQAVMDPDRLTNKDNGMGKIISRIVIMLAMFTAIIPLNIPYAEEGTYNAYLNENGLLFGTLYSLQSRIVGQNVIGKLIVGNVSTSTDSTLSEESNDIVNDKSKSAKELATFILKTFVRINLKKGATEAGAEDHTNFMCYPDTEDGEEAGYINAYMSKDTSPGEILDNINDWCNGPNGDDDNYTFVYTPIISTICGIFVVVMLFGYCIDIAVRALKMAVLRLIAPIPIISYIDPKSSKDGAFASWVKALTSTYLDLFLRLIIIFFVLFSVQEIIDHGLDIPIFNGTIGGISTVFIFVGMFYFARMAPKFVKDTLGLKGSLSNFGLSGMMAAAGAIRAGGNVRDALAASRNAADMQVAAFNQGKQAPGIGQSFTSGSDYMAQELTGNDKMTYKQMRRGERYLDREGLTAGRVENAKNDMFTMQDEAAKRKNEYENFVRGQMTAAEEEGLARTFGHMDDNGNYVMDDAERLRAANYLQESYLNAQANAGRQEALYKDMQAEMDKRGGSRNSYRAKHGDLREVHAGERDTRLGDLFSREGREAMRTGVFKETVRNVASIPRNEQLAASDNRNAKIDEAIKTDQKITNATNENMNNARQARNNRNNNP